VDVLEMLARLVDLTEAESAAIEAGDAGMIRAICQERGPLLAALPTELPAGGEIHVRRFLDLAERNLAAARAARDDIGRQLAHIGSGRAALAAYAPHRTPLVLERMG
jgi:hypothetical protein